jgi:hypothetical protein
VGVSDSSDHLTLDHEALPVRLDSAGFPVEVRFDGQGPQGVVTASVTASVETVDGPKDLFVVPVTARVR